jgi:hypothetical protein
LPQSDRCGLTRSRPGGVSAVVGEVAVDAADNTGARLASTR